jgi:hypothetical protein
MDPNELLNNPEQVKLLISMLQSLLPPQAEQNDTNKNVTKSTIGQSKIKKSKKNKSATATTNKFESMAEFRMHKEDTVIDKQLAKHAPVERTREFEFVDVVCRICGRKESVPPHLVFEGPTRYKCNRCSATSG